MLPAGELSIFMGIDTAIHVLTHFFCLVSWTRPRSNSKILLGLHFIQSMLVLSHGVELIVWNTCQSPTMLFAFWIIAHSVLLLAVLRSRFAKVQKRKVSWMINYAAVGSLHEIHIYS